MTLVRLFWLLLDWSPLSLLNPSMVRTKMTPGKGREEHGWKYKHRPKYKISQHLQHQWTPSASTRNIFQSRGNNKEDRGGRATETGGEVTRVVSNLTVGPDCCRGWAIYIGRRRPAHKMLPPTVGGQALRRNSCRLHHWKSPESTDWGQLLFTRSASSKRAQSSLFGKCPSHD